MTFQKNLVPFLKFSISQKKLEKLSFHFTLLSPKSVLSPKPIFFKRWKHLAWLRILAQLSSLPIYLFNN